MSSTTQTSIRVNDALERYGAKTFGTLPRRMERLQRFNDVKNRKYAEQIRKENEGAQANVVWPALTITREVSRPYMLRSSTRVSGEDILRLSRAIENGHVTTRRG